MVGTKKPDTKTDVWDNYYQKDKPVVNLIEKINEVYFSRVFEHYFKKYTPQLFNLKILEAACGSGLMSSRLATQGAETQLLDLSANALKVATENYRKTGQEFRGRQADILKMPYNDNTFDVVWNQGVLEHFNNPEMVVEEMLRVTKKGGVVILFVPAYLSPLHIVYKLLETAKLLNLWVFDKQVFFRTKKLRNIAKRVNCSEYTAKRLPWTLGFSSMLVVKKVI